MKSGWTKLALLLIACLITTNYFHSEDKIKGVIWADQEGYYIYLPAIFVHGGFENVPFINGCTVVETANGPRTFTKYTYGVALLQSPFFLTAHAVAPLIGFKRNGRSLPYIWAIMLAAIFYMLAGLTLLSKLLRDLKFDVSTTWFILLGILLGTNLFYYTFREAGMSHVYSFFLFSVLIYSSHKKVLSAKIIWSVLSASSLAFIILIRPTNAIAILIPLLWSVEPKNILGSIKDFFADWKWIVFFIIAAVVLFLPQLVYWKLITGNYLFYSYGNEGFVFWNRPKILSVLLSPQNGWLIYSPIAMMGLLGIGLMAKNKQSGWLLPAVLLSVATYIFASWWAWWFGGAYGHRCYVEYLPILAVPAAYAITKIRASQRWIQLGFSTLAVAAVFVNLRMSYIYQGMWDGPNWGWHNYLQKLFEVFYL